MDEQKVENPNLYSVRGEKLEFDPKATPEQMVKSYKNNTGEDVSLAEFIPLNPEHPNHLVARERTFGEKAIAFGTDAARPLFGAAATAGAVALGAPAIPAAIAGGAAAMSFDMLGQKMRGENPSISQAAINTGLDAVGGAVLKGVGAGLKWGAGKLAPIAGEAFAGIRSSLGQTLGDTGLGNFLVGAENLFAAKEKLKLLSSQAVAARSQVYNIIRPENEKFVETAADIIGNTIEKTVQQSQKRLSSFNEQAREQIAKIGKSVVAKIEIPVNTLSNVDRAKITLGLMEPPTKVVEQPIPLNASLAWAKQFLSREQANKAFPELLAEAKKIMSDSAGGEHPVEFRSLFNKFFASDNVYKDLAAGKDAAVNKTAKAHFADLNRAVRDDITNGLDSWELPGQAKMMVQDAWIKSRQAVDHAVENYRDFDGLQKLIQDTPGNKLQDINNILSNSDLLKKTIAVGSMKIGDKVVSKDIKGDLGTLYLKNKMDAAWDSVANRYDGNALLKIFQNGGPDDSVQRQLFNSQQRSDLTHFVNTLGHMQSKAPSGTPNMLFSKTGLTLGSGGSMAAMLLGGAVFGGAKLVSVELGIGALMNLAVKSPEIARKFANFAAGGAFKLGGGMQAFSAEVVAVLQGFRGVANLKDGQRVKGEWKNGKFVPTEY